MTYINPIIDVARFEAAKLLVLTGQHDPHGFGTLQEKTTHAVLKHYYAPNEDQHEIPIEGYIADIYDESCQQIIEIQNGNFIKMREKLKAFLPLYDVTIVYALPYTKQLLWVDETTGVVTKGGKSYRKSNAYTAIPELYRIKEYIKDPHLHIQIPLFEMEEYRLLNGWSKDKKRGSKRYDRVPVKFHDLLCFDCFKDYMQLIPIELAEEFTVKEFSGYAKIPNDLASFTVKFLLEINLLQRCGKKGNAYIYKIVE